MERRFKLSYAIPLILLAALTMTVVGIFIKLASKEVSMNLIVLARCTFNVFFLMLWVLFNPKVLSYKKLFVKREQTLLILRAIFGTGGIYAFYIAIKYIPLANAMVLAFSVPIFVPLIARIWLKIKLIHRLWWGIGIAFFGIILIVKPTLGFFHPATLLALSTAILAGIATTMIRQLHYKHPMERALFYYFMISFFISAIVYFLSPKAFEVHISNRAWLYLIIIGITSTLYVYFLSLGLKYVPARLGGIFLYSGPIFALLPDFLIWHKVPSWVTLIGIFTIIIGTVLMVLLYPKNDLVYIRKKR